MYFQETAYFQEKARNHYKTEAKNGALENAHGYNSAISYGITSMQMQSAMTMFAINLERIIKWSK